MQRSAKEFVVALRNAAAGAEPASVVAPVAAGTGTGGAPQATAHATRRYRVRFQIASRATIAPSVPVIAGSGTGVSDSSEEGMRRAVSAPPR